MLGATTAQLAGLLNDRVAAAVQIDTIRKVTPDGVVTTLAGTAGLSGSADGLGAAARFISPSAVTVDSADNVYILDTGTIRKITPEGNTTTIAGMAGVTEIVLGATPRFASPSGLAVIGNEIVISDTNATWVALLGAIASHLVQHANTFVGGRPEQVCWQGLFMNRYEHRKNELAERAACMRRSRWLAHRGPTNACARPTSKLPRLHGGRIAGRSHVP